MVSPISLAFAQNRGCDVVLVLKDGDYVKNGNGLKRADQQEELLQWVLFQLTARRGSFPFWGELGSRLWQLGRLPQEARSSAAAQYVKEALGEKTDLTVDSVELSQDAQGQIDLTAYLSWNGRPLAATVQIL